MENSANEESPSGEPPVAYFVRDGFLLPAVCPFCAAPGSHARPVTTKSGAPSEELDMHLCDLCAEQEQAHATRRIALVAAGALLLLSSVTAVTLFLGHRALLFQVLFASSVSLLVGLGLTRTPLWPRRRDPLVFLPKTAAENARLICRSRKYRRVLLEEGYQVAPLPEVRLRRSDAAHLLQIQLGLVLATLGALSLIHFLGGATVRVLQSGSESAYFLVDARKSTQISPANSEDPTSGSLVRVLGGRRHLQLVDAAGEILAAETKTIWPGRTYIVGHLPPGQCLFWEKRRYQVGNERSLFLPVGGSGPIWELTERVDSWFVPLGPSSQGKIDQGSALVDTSGGTRRALRLLPCRAHSASQNPKGGEMR